MMVVSSIFLAPGPLMFNAKQIYVNIAIYQNQTMENQSQWLSKNLLSNEYFQEVIQRI
jgi:hypothetical protein